MKSWNSINEFCDLVREASFSSHCYLKHGHLEKVYENGLALRLHKQGLKVVQQQPLVVRDEDGTEIGTFYADLFIEDRLVVELKAARAIDNEHIAQLLGYLRSSRVETGLLINFGASKFFIKKYLMSEINTS